MDNFAILSYEKIGWLNTFSSSRFVKMFTDKLCKVHFG